MSNPKHPEIDLAKIDQEHTAITAHLIPHYAAVFSRFCEEPFMTRVEALALTIAYIQRPPSKS